MRILALDVGDARIGCAVSDVTGRVASPLKTIDFQGVDQAKREIARICEEYEIESILVGLPLSMDGEEGPQARHVRVLASKLLSDSSLPVHFFDERLSSAQAKDALVRGGVDSKRSRGKIDMIAASLFLQAWLDR